MMNLITNFWMLNCAYKIVRFSIEIHSAVTFVYTLSVANTIARSLYLYIFTPIRICVLVMCLSDGESKICDDKLKFIRFVRLFVRSLVCEFVVYTIHISMELSFLSKRTTETKLVKLRALAIADSMAKADPINYLRMFVCIFEMCVRVCASANCIT